MRALRRGERVCEYDGPRFPKRIADKRYEGRDITYLFSLGERGEVIDGFGTAMFLNHSCSPNCETEEEGGRIYIRSLRSIAPGEELTYEYNLHDSEDDDCACYCGAAQCRGTMLSEDEVRRLQRRTGAKRSRRPSTR